MTDYLDRPAPADADVARVFDELSFWSAQFGGLLFEHLEIRRDATVLDLGCGNGFPLFELAHRFGRSSRVIGIDVWEAALLNAAGKLRVHGLPNVSLVRGDGADMPFADGTFDLIVSNVGVNNFEDAERGLAECARVTKPGGSLALTTNPKGHMREFYGAYRDVLTAAGHANLTEALDEQEAHRATEAQLRAMLEHAGFTVARVESGSFSLRYADGGTFFRHALTRFGFLDGWRSLLPQSAEREVFAALEERLDRTARADGHLTMTVPMLYLEGRRRE